MYKIFIDTNIILDFYRVKNRSNIEEILDEIPQYKKYLISTEQSKDEFLRNRDRTISDFIEELKKQNYKALSNSIIATLDTYEDYKESIEKANKDTQKVINKIKELVENPEKDLIYQMYLKLSQDNYSRTNDIIERAIKRKYIGNPPVSDKNTCGDEIIWETILEYCKDDLIIVSRDATFASNFSFLKLEFKQKTGKELRIVDTISQAIELNNELPPEELEKVESELIVDTELEEYGELQDNSKWVNIIYNALKSLNNEADLQAIYTECKNIIKKKYPEKLNNKEIDATIRGVLQRYSSDSEYFNRKLDLFVNVSKGRWAIRELT